MAVNSCCILSLMSIILFRYVSIFRMRLQIYEIFIRNTDNYFELLQYLLFCHSKRLLTCPPLSRLHFYFSFLFRLQDCIKDVYLSHCILNLK